MFESASDRSHSARQIVFASFIGNAVSDSAPSTGLPTSIFGVTRSLERCVFNVFVPTELSVGALGPQIAARLEKISLR